MRIKESDPLTMLVGAIVIGGSVWLAFMGMMFYEMHSYALKLMGR